METDDGIRGKEGVLLSLRNLENGIVRVIMDDVSNEAGSVKKPWNHEVVVTWKDYENEEFTENNISEKELADLGAYVVARLNALRMQGYKRQ